MGFIYTCFSTKDRPKDSHETQDWNTGFYYHVLTFSKFPPFIDDNVLKTDLEDRKQSVCESAVMATNQHVSLIRIQSLKYFVISGIRIYLTVKGIII